MSETVLYTLRNGAIDGANATTTAFTNVVEIGIIYVGGAKTEQRRFWALFDLYAVGDKIQSGAPLNAGSRIVAGSLIISPFTAWKITAPLPPFPAHMYRLLKTSEIDGVGTTWVNYATGLPWTTAGGDVAQGPGASVAWATPTLGNLRQGGGSSPYPDQYIDITSLVLDAHQQRGGLLSILGSLDNENPGNPNDTYQTYNYSSNFPLQFIRLSVTTLTQRAEVV